MIENWFDLIDNNPSDASLRGAVSFIAGSLLDEPESEITSSLLISWGLVQARLGVASWNHAILISPQLARLEFYKPRRLLSARQWQEMWRVPQAGANRVIVNGKNGPLAIFREEETDGAGELPPHPDDIIGALEPESIDALARASVRIGGADIAGDEMAILRTSLGLAFGPPSFEEPAALVLPRAWRRGPDLELGFARMEATMRLASIAIFILTGMVAEAQALEAKTMAEVKEAQDGPFTITAPGQTLGKVREVVGALFSVLSEIRWTGPQDRQA